MYMKHPPNNNNEQTEEKIGRENPKIWQVPGYKRQWKLKWKQWTQKTTHYVLTDAA